MFTGSNFQSILFVFLVLSASSTFAQLYAQNRVLVTVFSQDSLPVADASVEVYSEEGGDLLFFEITDQKGMFSFDAGTYDSLLFFFSHLSYGIHKIKKNKAEWQGNKLAINLAAKKIELKEVVVSSRRSGVIFKGDTISFDLSVLRTGNENDVKSLLRAVPGLEIGENGSISFNGRKVDEILLNDKNVIQSQFEVLNNLFRPDELLTAEMINAKKEEAPLMLNLILDKPRKEKFQIAGGLTHDKRVELDANRLKLQPGSEWSSVVTARFNNWANPVLSEQDFLRAQDFDYIVLKRKYNRSESIDLDLGTFSPPVFSDKEESLFQLSLNRKNDASTTNIFVRYLGSDKTVEKEHIFFSVFDNAPIGGSEELSNRRKQDALVRGSHQFDRDRLSLKLFAGVNLAILSNESAGSSFFQGAQQTHSYQSKQANTGGYVSANLIYALGNGYYFDFYNSTTLDRESSSHDILDGYDVFEAAELLASGQFSFSTDQAVTTKSAFNAFSFKKAMKNLELAVGSNLVWASVVNQSESPVESNRFNLLYEKKIFEYSPFLKASFNRDAFKSSVLLKSKNAFSYGSTTVIDEDIRQNNAPYVQVSLQYELSQNVQAELRYQYREDYISPLQRRRVPLVQDNRNYEFDPVRTFSDLAMSSLNVNIKYLRPSIPAFAFINIFYSSTDSVIYGYPLYLEGYQVQSGRMIEGNTRAGFTFAGSFRCANKNRMTIRGTGMQIKGKTLNADGLPRASTTTLYQVQPGYQFFLVRQRFSTSTHFELSYTRQAFQGSTLAYSAFRIVPRVDISYKIAKWYFEMSGRYDSLRNFNPQNILSFNIQWAPTSKLKTEMGVFDLLNFNGNSYALADFSDNEIRVEQYRTIGGYFYVKVGYSIDKSD